jgi:hypothetical protein
MVDWSWAPQPMAHHALWFAIKMANGNRSGQATDGRR